MTYVIFKGLDIGFFGPKDRVPQLDEFPTVTPEEWMKDEAMGSETRRLRKVVLWKFEEANGTSVGRIPGIGRDGKLSACLAGKMAIDYLAKTSSPYGLHLSLSTADMLLSTLGERRLSRTAFNRIVTCASPYLVHSKKIPMREQVADMPKAAQPLHRALVAVLAVCGMRMRINEALSRKWSDPKIREDGQARVSIKAPPMRKVGIAERPF